jgi:uncharacterized protein YjbJ (UPF0337 family)
MPHRPRAILRTSLKGKHWNPNTTLRSIVDIRYQETIMNKDQIKGRIKEAKGKVKEVTVKIVSDKTIEEKGKVQATIGKVQAAYGDRKDDLKRGG